MKNKYLILIVFILVLFYGIKNNTIINNVIKLSANIGLKGDVNNDGKVNSTDYILVKNFILNKKEFTDDEKNRADCNSDNKISSLDYIKIKQIIMSNASSNTTNNTKKTYTVTFDSNGGNANTAQVIEEGNKVKKPTNPKRKGYYFIEWQLNNVTYNFDSVVTKDIKIVAVWIKLDNTSYKLKTNDKQKIKYTIEPSKANVNMTYSTNNKTVATVDNSGLVYAASAGNASIAVNVNKNKVSDVEIIVDYGYFDTCSTSKSNTKLSLKTTKNNTVNIYACLENQSWRNLNQGFAVTKDSVIYTGSSYYTWCKPDSTYKVAKHNLSGECNTMDYGVAVYTSGNYIRKFDRKTGKFIVNYVDVGGHGQSFDATGNNEIYINYFPQVYLHPNYGYGSSTTGIAYISRFGKNNEYLNPTMAFRIMKNGNIEVSKSNYAYGSIDYLKYIVDKAKEEGVIASLEHAIDEEHDQIAIVRKNWTNNSNKTLFIYKLSDFKKGKKTLLGTYYLYGNMCYGKSSCFEQGIELYGDYVYSVHEINKDNKHYEGVSKIKYKTCSKIDVKQAKCDLEEIAIPGDTIGTEYANNGAVKYVVGLSEVEGISVYKGKVYTSLITKAFSNKWRYITTVLVDGL